MSRVSPPAADFCQRVFSRAGDGSEARVKLTQVALGEGRRGKLALRTPCVAFGVEHAPDPDFRQNAVDTGVAPKPFGSRTQSFLDQRRVSRGDDAFRAHPELVGRAESRRPFLHDEMTCCSVELVQIADQRQRPRAGQVIYRTRRGDRSRRRLEAGDVDEDGRRRALRQGRTPGIPDRLRDVRSRPKSASDGSDRQGRRRRVLPRRAGRPDAGSGPGTRAIRRRFAVGRCPHHSPRGRMVLRI